MRAEASSSSGHNSAPRAPHPPPIAASSSSRSAASSGVVGFVPPPSTADPIDAAKGRKFQKWHSSAVSSDSSPRSLLQLSSAGDAIASSSSDSDPESDSCSDDQVEIEAVTPEPTDWTAADRCPYYPPDTNGCTHPRSCRDCLNVDVGDGYSCMVNQYGRCVQKTPSTYVKALDFKNQEPSNDGEACEDQRVQFPAWKANYCPVGDKECKHCKETVFADVMNGRINGSLTKFCYGADGCVCIAVCEADIWTSTIGQTVCNGTVVNGDYESEHAKMSGGSDGGSGGLDSLALEIVGGVAAAVVFVAAVMYVRKRRRAASEDSSSGASGGPANAQTGSSQGGEDGEAPMAVPVLSLFGWQAMREELIEREQLLLAGVEDFSNVRTGYLQLLDVDASAPPPEEDESSAPVLLVPLAGASAPTFSPRGVAALASAPSAPPESPSAPPASPTYLEEQLL